MTKLFGVVLLVLVFPLLSCDEDTAQGAKLELLNPTAEELEFKLYGAGGTISLELVYMGKAQVREIEILCKGRVYVPEDTHNFGDLPYTYEVEYAEAVFTDITNGEPFIFSFLVPDDWDPTTIHEDYTQERRWLAVGVTTNSGTSDLEYEMSTR
ncbi:MAG: hypothetical protein ABJN36_03515 [Cyclobacteriaceae bacterium]